MVSYGVSFVSSAGKKMTWDIKGALYYPLLGVILAHNFVISSTK